VYGSLAVDVLLYYGTCDVDLDATGAVRQSRAYVHVICGASYECGFANLPLSICHIGKSFNVATQPVPLEH
jgi:hypothetical protein